MTEARRTDSTRSKLASGAMIVAISRIAINLIAFASTIFLARLLAPADFGLVAIATAATAIVFAMTELSLAEALVQHATPSSQHFDTALTLNVLRAGGIGIVLAALSVPLAMFYHDNRLVTIMLAIAISTLISGWINPKLILFQRRLSFWQDALVAISQKVAGFVVAISIAWLFRSYWALVLGSIAAQVCTVVVSYALVPYRPRFGLAKSGELMSFSIWLTFSRAINAINWRSDPLAIGYFLGPVQLGYYSVGENLAALPTREAIAPVAQTLFPAFATIANDTPRLRQAYRESHALLCGIAFPAGLGFSLVADPLVFLLLGVKWIAVVPIIQVLSIVIGFQALSSSLYPLAMATGNTKAIFRRDLRNFFVRVPLVIGGMFVGTGTGIGGVMGVILGRAAADIIGTIWNMQLVRDILDLPLPAQTRTAFRPFVAAGAMVIPVLLVVPGASATSDPVMLALGIAWSAAVGGIVYGSVSLALWAATGKPTGPEAIVLKLIAKARRIELGGGAI